LQQVKDSAVTIGKGMFLFLVFGLLPALSASQADLLQVTFFSRVLTAIAEHVGGNHLIVSGLVKKEYGFNIYVIEGVRCAPGKAL
jgi:hypothetical protein